MKHDLSVTLILILLFLASHFIGLFIIKNYLPSEKNLPLGIEKPQFEERTAYIPIIISILFATAIALILIRFAAFKIWKAWYFLSVFVTITIAFAAFIPEIAALILALGLTIFRTFKPNVIIHNFTEVFIYGGLAAIFVPVLSIWSIFVLLVLISIYDMVAVWKTQHMVSMAKFQVKSKMFAGLLVPSSAKNLIMNSKKETKHVARSKHNKNAILGGGDIAFPLLFSGVMLKNFGFYAALITSFTAALALLILFFMAEKKKFYPAMPFISAGSLVGYILIYLAL
ncbi:hypothetical protein HYU23_02620 [Candidatus Woesearchaeota archaeon]|nr:hypothetical protein [Candidatus Woesearchaeota archaeon]